MAKFEKEVDPVQEYTLACTDLAAERNKRLKDRMPLYEAYLELSVKVANNAVRKLNDLPPEYHSV